MNRITKIGLPSFAATSLAIPAIAQTLECEYRLGIESQPTEATFAELSEQTNLEIGYGLEEASRNFVVVPGSTPYGAEVATEQLPTFRSLSDQHGNQCIAAVAERARHDSTSERRATQVVHIATLTGGAV